MMKTYTESSLESSEIFPLIDNWGEFMSVKKINLGKPRLETAGYVGVDSIRNILSDIGFQQSAGYFVLGKPVNTLNCLDFDSFLAEARCAIQPKTESSRTVEETKSIFGFIYGESEMITSKKFFRLSKTYYVDKVGNNVTFKFFRDPDTIIQYTIRVTE